MKLVMIYSNCHPLNDGEEVIVPLEYESKELALKDLKEKVLDIQSRIDLHQTQYKQWLKDNGFPNDGVNRNYFDHINPRPKGDFMFDNRLYSHEEFMVFFWEGGNTKPPAYIGPRILTIDEWFAEHE